MAEPSITDQRFHRLLMRAVLMPFLILAVVAGGSVWLINNLLRANAWLEHTHEVIDEAQHSQGLLADMQRGVRGFMLTGDELYLEPYPRAFEFIDGSFQRLRGLVSNNKEQIAQLDAIGGDFELWRRELGKLILARRTAGSQPMAFDDSDDRRLMSQMRGRLTNLIAPEQAQLESRAMQAANTTRWTVIFSLGLLGIAALAIAWLTWGTLVSLSRSYSAAIASLREQSGMLARVNESFQSLLRASPLPVVALDGGNRVTLWNPAAEKLFGWTQDEVLGKPIPHIPEFQEAQSRDIFDRSMRGESFTDLEIVRETKDGRFLAISLASAPLRDAVGQIIGMITVSTDITQRKRAAAELENAKTTAERASHAKDQFLAVLSHELRTPLTPALAAIASLEDDGRLAEELRPEVAMVRRNIELEARLIDDMLDLTRIARGKLRLKLEPVDVHTALTSALQVCQADIDAKQLDVEVRLSASHTIVRADPARLQQVFWNILKNSVKFTPNNGRLSLSTTDINSAIRIEITDTGTGITPDVLPRIFNAFEQGEVAVTRQFGGLGLGLAICRMLTEAMRGRISASSPGRNKGATFTVDLPTLDVPAAAEEPSRPTTDPEKRRQVRILLVEDHEDTSLVMARLLRGLGYQLRSANSVQAALAEAQTQTFDLVVSDIGLPDGTGHELIRALRAIQPVVGIALSGFGMESDLRNSRDAGFVEHLTKPVDIEALDRTIQAVISSSVTAFRG